MRRHVLILTIVLFKSSIFGQSVYIKVGPSFSNLQWSNSIVYDQYFDKGIIGFSAFTGINYLNYKYFNISSGIGYIQKGGSKITLGCSVPKDYYPIERNTIRLNFFTINTTFNLKIPIKDVIEPCVFAGPKMDYLFSYNESKDFIKKREANGKLNKFYYGVILGGGVNFNIKKCKLGLVFDYSLSLNKIVNYSGMWSTATGMVEVKEKLDDNTYTLTAQIGYYF